MLILSSCVGSPFSFGRRTYLFDLFTEAGFRVVEDHETIRHMNPSEPIKTISGLSVELGLKSYSFCMMPIMGVL